MASSFASMARQLVSKSGTLAIGSYCETMSFNSLYI
jgi:hypothetical protein